MDRQWYFKDPSGVGERVATAMGEDEITSAERVESAEDSERFAELMHAFDTDEVRNIFLALCRAYVVREGNELEGIRVSFYLEGGKYQFARVCQK